MVAQVPARTSGLLVAVAWIQGVFYIATGVWSLVSLDTFEAVTGPKVDDWLVKTVGVLVIVSGVVFLMSAVRRAFPLEVLVLAVGNAVVLMGIDVTYVMLGRIAPIYLADAAAELVLAALWCVGWAQAGRTPPVEEAET